MLPCHLYAPETCVLTAASRQLARSHEDCVACMFYVGRPFWLTSRRSVSPGCVHCTPLSGAQQDTAPRICPTVVSGMAWRDCAARQMHFALRGSDQVAKSYPPLTCISLMACRWLIAIAFWLSGGFIKSGLGKRVAYAIVSVFGKTTLGLTYSLVFAEALLAPAIPSVAARAGVLQLYNRRTCCKPELAMCHPQSWCCGPSLASQVPTMPALQGVLGLPECTLQGVRPPFERAPWCLAHFTCTCLLADLPCAGGARGPLAKALCLACSSTPVKNADFHLWLHPEASAPACRRHLRPPGQGSVPGMR